LSAPVEDGMGISAARKFFEQDYTDVRINRIKNLFFWFPRAGVGTYLGSEPDYTDVRINRIKNLFFWFPRAGVGTYLGSEPDYTDARIIRIKKPFSGSHAPAWEPI